MPVVQLDITESAGTVLVIVPVALIVVAATVLGVVAPIAVEFRPVEVN